MGLYARNLMLLSRILVNRFPRFTFLILYCSFKSCNPNIISTMSSVLKEGNTAVVTGASSGIGRAAVLECVRRGMHVWMVDLDGDELALAHELALSRKVADTQVIQQRLVDVSEYAAIQVLAEEVFTTQTQACHFLFNNAGIGRGGGALTDMDTVTHVMKVNTYGPIHACLAFVPRMKLQAPQECLVVNTGSKQGITMPPGNLTYNMSKAALKCYTEGLCHELTVKEKTNIKVALLVPGWVNTSILLKSLRATAAAAGEELDVSSVFFHEDKPAAGAWMPQQVVDYMIQALDENTFYIICPDNDVDRETDNLRMQWTMGDIVENRPPLSRWNPDYAHQFQEFVAQHKK
jgi:NAD(P)-dependent dehydrogenase (short-subunit alcohol dehydrogenase family)